MVKKLLTLYEYPGILRLLETTKGGKILFLYTTYKILFLFLNGVLSCILTGSYEIMIFFGFLALFTYAIVLGVSL